MDEWMEKEMDGTPEIEYIRRVTHHDVKRLVGGGVG